MPDSWSTEDTKIRLSSLRNEIDAADEEILRLLNRRALLSLEVGKVKASSEDGKRQIFDPTRERQVLDNLELWNKGPLPRRHLENIWREIFSSSRALQRPQRVAYLGPEGTFSHLAALEFLGAAPDFIAQPNLPAVFQAVWEESCDVGIVPLENSLQGSVGQALDLFLEYELFILAELFRRISHSLLSRENSVTAVRTIYSHSQPLAQCAGRLRAEFAHACLVPTDSTAAAAERAAEEAGAAALGHRGLADSLHLNILSDQMEDAPNNQTRFAVIGRFCRPGIRPHPRKNLTISSLLFTLPDKAGALAGVLNTLAGAGLNMRKLESRPLRGENWRYVFFADVECDLNNEVSASVLEELRARCMHFRILGVYPDAVNHMPASLPGGEVPA